MLSVIHNFYQLTILFYKASFYFPWKIAKKQNFYRLNRVIYHFLNKTSVLNHTQFIQNTGTTIFTSNYETIVVIILYARSFSNTRIVIKNVCLNIKILNCVFGCIICVCVGTSTVIYSPHTKKESQIVCIACIQCCCCCKCSFLLFRYIRVQSCLVSVYLR